MYILGISCYYHDAAACLLKDGQVIAAAQEERFSRIKHDSAFPAQAIKFCLDAGGIKGSQLEYVVFNEKPFLKFERIIKTILATYPFSGGTFQETVISWMGNKLWIKSLIQEQLGLPAEKVLFCQHHLSHAAAAFFCSPFSEAAILTMDGVGEWTTAARGEAQGDWISGQANQLRLAEEIRFPHSLGLLYSVFTAFLGFEVNEGEYKVMGMSAFGEPKYTDKILKLIKISADGSFRLNMQYFAYHYNPRRSFNKRFIKLFGQPKNPKSRFVTVSTPLYNSQLIPTEEEIKTNQYYADIAASLQKITEDILIKAANSLYAKSGHKQLCLSGGVALNCLANSRIMKETQFDEIFIQPASGDSGSAMGAALYVYHCLLAQPRKFILKHAYWGKAYTQEEIERILVQNKATYRLIEDEAELIASTADALTQGKVIGWFQGRAEWGPRALGNRSILADPRREEMKDTVNIKIKFREPFRPFAATVLVEQAEELFELAGCAKQYPFKFMLYTAVVKQPKLLAAVSHIDHSSRIQIITQQDNPLYYKLIERFYHKTGVAALLNTSFNLNGEPIVNSPQDAFDTFLKSGMDMLVIGKFLLTK